jgi:hypothetical protein
VRPVRHRNHPKANNTQNGAEDSPSFFPPLNVFPCSLALLAKGISFSSFSSVACRPEMRRAREQRASLNIPASVRRRRIRSVAVDSPAVEPSKPFTTPLVSPRNSLRNLTTSSTTSSSHRLSLRPSLARIRISSA